MSTTHIYGFNFLIPIGLTDTPMTFSMFNKGDDTYYTYNEYMALPGKKAFYTPSETHAIFGFNVTSTKLRSELEAQLAATSFAIYDGVDTANWEDVDQTNYLWIIPTEPLAPEYNYDAFIKVSPLFNVV